MTSTIAFTSPLAPILPYPSPPPRCQKWRPRPKTPFRHCIYRPYFPHATLTPPNAEVDWVIVDLSTSDLPSPSPTNFSEAQDDAKSIIRFLLRDAPAELSVVLTTDTAIQALNAKWRGVDAPTDVLSFPQDDPDRVVLGDVVVSVETAARQAAERSVTLRDEIRILLVHGVLHLLGYDHVGKTDGDWLVMANMENRVLKGLCWPGEGLVAAGLADGYGDVVRA